MEVLDLLVRSPRSFRGFRSAAFLGFGCVLAFCAVSASTCSAIFSCVSGFGASRISLCVSARAFSRFVRAAFPASTCKVCFGTFGSAKRSFLSASTCRMRHLFVVWFSGRDVWQFALVFSRPKSGAEATNKLPNKALHPTAYSSVRRSSSLRFRRRVSLSFCRLRAA